MTRGRWPVGPLTVATALLTCTVSAVGLTMPAVIAALQRRPGEYGDGQPWRLVTSLLVHDGWIALAGNLLALVIIGAAAERALRPGPWVALYLLGGLTGQFAGLAWEPTGAGDSVAILGLLGGVTALALRGRDQDVLALAYGVVWLLALVVAHVDSTALSSLLVGGVVAAGALIARRRAPGGVAPLPPLPVAVAVLVAALALVGLRDIHGPALLVSVAVAVAATR